MGHIYKRDLESGKVQRLTRQDDHFEFFPTFSRDGKKIAYVTWDDEKQGSVRVVSARSGRGDTLTSQPGKYVEPAFSPNGETVVFRKSSGSSLLAPQWSLKAGIYAVDSDGDEQPELITEHGYQPQFGKANDRIYVMRPWPKPFECG